MPEENAVLLEKEFGNTTQAIYSILNLWAAANWIKGWIKYTGKGTFPRKASVKMTSEQVERAKELHSQLGNLKRVYEVMHLEGLESTYDTLYYHLVLKVQREVEHEQDN